MRKISTKSMLTAAGITLAAASTLGSHFVMNHKTVTSSESPKLKVDTRSQSSQSTSEELNQILSGGSNANPFNTPPAGLKAMAKEMQEAMRLPEREKDGVRLFYVVKQYWDNDNHDEKGAYYVDVDDDKAPHCYKLFDSSVFGPYISKGSTAAEGQFYAIYATSNHSPWWDYYVRYDVEDWQWNDFWNDDIQISGPSLAYDPWTDQMFGYSNVNYGKSQYALAVFDWEKRTRRVLGPTIDFNDRIAALAADVDVLYGFGADWKMYKIDKKTGEKTEIGTVSVLNDNIATTIQTISAVIDMRTRRLFFAGTYYDRTAGANYSALWEINKETAEATVIFDHKFNQQDVGFWSEELSNMKSPDLATDLTIDVPVGELEGTFSFTAPTKLRNGDDTSGALKYEVVMNGEKIGSGNTNCGETVTIPLKVEAADSYKISVKVENNAGPSRWSRIESVIGFAKPAAPVVNVEFDANKVPTLTWNAVTKSNAGVDIEGEQITYNIVRYPDNVLVAEDITETTFTDNADLDANYAIYSYGVSSRYYGITSSDETVTPGFFRGVAEAPVEFGPFTKSNSAAFDVINGNEDEYAWNFNDAYDAKRDYMQLWQTYKPEETNDDWLIAPPVRLQAGKYYRVEFLIDPYYNTDVKYEIRLGKSAKKEDLTTLVEKNSVYYKDHKSWHGDFVKITEDGAYRPALGMTGTMGTGGANCYGYRISAAKDPGAPNSPTNFTGRSNINDSKLLEMSFNAPAIDFDGNALDIIDKISISRDGEELIVYKNVRPGQTITFTNTVEETGREYTYKIVAENKFGEGRELYAPVYAGVRKSAPVRDAFAWQSAPDKIKISWKAPETDEIGNPINPADITYNISQLDGYIKNIIAKDLTDLSYEMEYTSENPNEQEIISFDISTVTESGESESIAVIPVMFGNPVKYPYIESLAGGQLKNTLGIHTLVGSAKWGLYSDASFTDLQSYDNDNGLLGMNSSTRGDAALLLLPKVSLANAVDPVISFYTYNINGSAGADDNEVEILVNDGSGFESIFSSKISDLGRPEWNRVKASLAAYKGKDIQVAIKGIIQTYTFILVDNIRIADNIANNVAIMSASAQEEATAGEDVIFRTRIENTGDNVAENTKLQLILDDEVVAENVIEKLEAGEGIESNLIYASSPLLKKRKYFRIKLVAENDEIESDNLSDVFRVQFNAPVHPVVTGLTAERGEDLNVSLNWEKPDLSDSPALYATENFNGAEPWIQSEVCGWTLIDKDGLPAGGMQNLVLPGFKDEEGNSVPVGFFVVDSASDVFGASAASWASYSGNRHLCSIYSVGGANDDWAISPKLGGKKQTVSFYARSYSGDYKETLRVLASSTDKEIENFTELETFADMSEEWTRYEVELPEGTEYFAFNCVSNDCFMLFLDAVTFSAEDSVYELLGYNVYRNEVKINNAMLTSAAYTDANVPEGSHEYVVTAVYNAGESAPSEAAMIEVSGLKSVFGANVQILTPEGGILVLNAEGMNVAVNDAAGRIRYNGKPAGNLKISCEPGVYVVNINNRSIKVVVK